MKKEIRLMLDYQCHPIWIYDEDGKFLDNDYPAEIRENEEIMTLLKELQERYESLFINNEVEFSYVGFKSKEEGEYFNCLVKKVYSSLRELLGETYTVKNLVDIAY